MSAQRLIEELEARSLVSDRVSAKLREKLALSEKPLSAKALAKFLVEKQHITQVQATEALGVLLRSGVDVDPSAETVKSPPVIQQIKMADTPAEDHSAESSSIFEPFLSSSEPEAEAEREEEEFTLAPDSDAPPLGIRLSPAEEEPVSVELFPEPPPEPRTREKRSKEAVDRVDLDDPLAPVDKEMASKKKASRAAADALSFGEKKSPRSKKKPTKPQSEWDSPLIMWGGGGLFLLLVAGAVIYYLLYWETGDDKLKLAQDAVKAGSYTQAITHYKEFLEQFPRHKDRSSARVQLALVRLRRAVEAADQKTALRIAQEELEAIEGEEKFNDAHGELAALLPRVALGLADEAEKSTDAAQSSKLVEQTNTALGLINNTKYVPKSLRDEGELDEVRETLSRVERRQQSRQDLQQSIAAMEKAIADGEIGAAYAAHVAVIKQHPELTAAPALAEMIQKTTTAEQVAIRFTKEERPAETVERPTPWVASLAVANRLLKPAAAAAQATDATTIACVRVDGALYGLEAATGKLLWRRYVGFGSAWPQRFENDIIIADARYHELLRLDAKTGGLIWRQSIDASFAPPLIVAARAFVAAESGRLYVLDLKSGARAGYVQFTQPLRVAPTFSRNHGCLYLSGDHSTVYSLSAETLACNGVFYVGHAAGSVAKSPAVVMDKLALVENDGAATSRLRLLSLGENGAISGQVADRRLTGLPTAAPFIAGRRLVVVTDRGQIEVYDIGERGEDALTPVATRVATGNSPLVRHAVLTKQNIWIGDTQLTKFSILPTGNRLPVEPIENDFVGSVFDHPLAQFGDALVHVRRAKGRAGGIVAATSTAQGKTLWETIVAAPPAGAPVVDESAKSIAVANADGRLFCFDEAAIRTRVQDEPLLAQAAPSPPPALSNSVDLGQGRAAFCAGSSDQLLLYNPALGQAARWIKLDSPLACDVTPLGESIVAPLSIGQVFLLSSADGSKLAAPFQTVLQPQKEWRFKPAAAVDAAAGQFVISDGEQKIYLVTKVNGAQPQLQATSDADTSSPIESPLVVLGDSVIAVAGSSNLVRFQLPSLEAAGDATLPAPVVWGPHRAGDLMLLATANNELMAVAADGKVAWRAPFEHSDLTGAPLPIGENVLIAYRKGVVERRSLVDGKSVAAVDVEQPLATGPVSFIGRLLVVTNDGTLLVVDQP